MEKLRAGFLIAITLLLSAAYMLMSQLNGTTTNERIDTIVFSLFPLVGGLLLARHPRNPVSWIVSLLGLSALAAGTAYEYASLQLRGQTAGLPLTGEAAWLSLVLWSTIYLYIVLLLLLFPNGRLPGPRWKPLIFLAFLFTLPLTAATMVIAWRNRHVVLLMETGQVERTPEYAGLFRAFDIWGLLMTGIILLAMVGFFYRFSRSRGVERQQLKWFVFGLSSIPISLVLNEVSFLANQPGVENLTWAVDILSKLGFPVVLWIAITRYRLYDIDFIIRRTLLYTILTLTLAAIYLGIVLLTQLLFTQRFGEQPAIIIVLSTLLVAALFQPLRRRFQSAIDRRFYRRQYNTEQTLQNFAAHLQNQVDLDEIQRYFITIINENIQPEQSELWLKKS